MRDAERYGNDPINAHDLWFIVISWGMYEDYYVSGEIEVAS